MSASRFFTLKEARLSNNCPECYSNDSLEVVFKQKFIENTFYKAITAETVNELHCLNCDTQIFPIRWTDDIESVVDYQKRALQPKPKSIKLKPISWILIITILVLIIVSALFATEIFSF
ncbi:hypothetical protein [uncultured Winogradskyella sp.]|uniref:hypothetical protein n=1 Tax=uncultured Winogradskyella sp. TaxID=395353 RepID=UPI002639A397|nr:hypothetical protein [uncultured Winogradskyella sp.]